MMKNKIPLGSRAVSLFLSVGCQLMAAGSLWACPRCVDATPYKTGMQLAVAVLLPVPFALAYGIYRFIRYETKAGPPEI